jgi:hypothetical protein
MLADAQSVRLIIDGARWYVHRYVQARLSLFEDKSNTCVPTESHTLQLRVMLERPLVGVGAGHEGEDPDEASIKAHVQYAKQLEDSLEDEIRSKYRAFVEQSKPKMVSGGCPIPTTHRTWRSQTMFCIEPT